MDPLIWGRPFWFLLHTITLNYPNQPTEIDIADYSQFVRLFQKMLPCETCQQHFGEFIKQYPIEKYLQKKEDFILWMNTAHNNVNKSNGKEEMSVNDMIEIYRLMYLDPSQKKLQSFFTFHDKSKKKQLNQLDQLDHFSSTSSFFFWPKQYTFKFILYISSIIVLSFFILVALIIHFRKSNLFFI